MFARLEGWARTIKRDAVALFLAARDPRTPWYAQVMAALVAAYALSPIDLIPDFIPVLGYLDDLVIVPLGIWIVVRLLPSGLMQEFRAEAARMEARSVSRAGALATILLWIVSAGLLVWWFWPRPAT